MFPHRARRTVRVGWRRRGALLRATALLLAVSVRLRRNGYRATAEWLDRRAETNRRPAGTRPDLSEAHELALVVRMAGRAVPDATCLRRALVLRYLLGGTEGGASVRLGVRSGPADGTLSFHAWVVFDGYVVSEPAAQLEGFVDLGDGQPSGVLR